MVLVQNSLSKTKRGQKLLAVALMNFLLDSLNFDNSEYRETTTSALVIYRITMKGGQVTISDKFVIKALEITPNQFGEEMAPLLESPRKTHIFPNHNCQCFPPPFLEVGFDTLLKPHLLIWRRGFPARCVFLWSCFVGLVVCFFGGFNPRNFRKHIIINDYFYYYIYYY